MSPAVGIVAVVQLPLYPVVIGPLAGWLHFSLQVTAVALQLGSLAALLRYYNCGSLAALLAWLPLMYSEGSTNSS